MMLLVNVIFLLTSARNAADALNCPYSSLVADEWRKWMRDYQNMQRRVIAKYGVNGVLPKPKQMNEMAWNCETEYNLFKMQPDLSSNNTVVYRNFGVNTGSGGEVQCEIYHMLDIPGEWDRSSDQIPPNLQYNGNATILSTANVLKWNSTEMACAYKSFDGGNSVRLVCVYNARGDVVGKQIYEEGNESCKDGTQCGDNGTCVDHLCRVPTSNPDVLLPIYNPSLTCSNSVLMSQFSRYYAVNMHNYYRRLIAMGWAESKLTLFTPRAVGMGALSYDCSLEETAAESAKKCESSFTTVNKYSMDGGINRAVIKETNISKEGAIEQAIFEWFSELQRYDVNPGSVLDADSTALNVTNIMHDKYRRVGCAVNYCAMEGFTIVECRYGPSIPQSGDMIYAEGPPCSKCDGSEKCAFEVLCQT